MACCNWFFLILLLLYNRLMPHPARKTVSRFYPTLFHLQIILNDRWLHSIPCCCCISSFWISYHSFYEKKKGPMQLPVLCSPKTQILLQTFIANIIQYRVRTCWKLLGTLWFLIPWTTLPTWYSHGYALKSSKICFQPLKYFFILLHLIAERRKSSILPLFTEDKKANKHTHYAL